LLNAEGDAPGAMEVLNFLRIHDPENQHAIRVSVLILVRSRQAHDAVMLLYRSRHPRTREHLASKLAGLAREAKTGKDRDLLRREQAFVETLDQLAVHPDGKPAINAAKRFLKYTPPTGQKDMRPFVLYAALALAQNDRSQAEDWARPAQGRSLLPTHRQMMHDAIKELLHIPAWRELLGDE
jgi:hypothetical protein